MDNLELNIRNAVRAVIIRDGRILLLRKEYEDGSEQFALPGGGQDTGETLTMALGRECQEEIGADVQIGSLLYVADRFKPRDTPPGQSAILSSSCLAAMLWSHIHRRTVTILTSIRLRCSGLNSLLLIVYRCDQSPSGTS